MPRNGSGVYALPSGSTAVSGETALAATHNTPLVDIQTDLNTDRPLVAGGTGASTAEDARTNLAAAGSYPTKAAAQAASIGATVQDFILAGYSTAGDGGYARYKRAASEPSHNGKLQSIDGAWWEIDAPGGVNVRQFGAVGDNSTDDAVALQAALDWADAVGGGTVTFPVPNASGAWYSTVELEIKDRTRVIFEGSGGAGSASNENYLRFSADPSNGVKVSAFKGVYIEGMAIDMQDMNSTAVGFFCDRTWHGSYDKIIVFNTDQVGQTGISIKGDTGNGNYYNVWTNCNVTGTGGTPGGGWKLEGFTGGTPVNLTSQRFVGCSTSAVNVGWDISHYASGIVFIDARAEQCISHGFSINDDSGSAIQMFGGEITGNGGYGVEGDGLAVIHEVSFGSNTSGDIDHSQGRMTQYEKGQLRQRTQALTASDQLNPDTLPIRVTAAGAITMASNPQVLDGLESGQLLLLTGSSNTNTVTFVDGNGLRLAGNADATLALDDTLLLKFDVAAGDWEEVARTVRAPRPFTVTNYTDNNSIDANAVTTAQLADFVASLVLEFQGRGLLRGTVT